MGGILSPGEGRGNRPSIAHGFRSQPGRPRWEERRPRGVRNGPRPATSPLQPPRSSATLACHKSTGGPPCRSHPSTCASHRATSSPPAAPFGLSCGRRLPGFGRTAEEDPRTEVLRPCFPHSLNRRASACGSGRTPAPQPSPGPGRARGGCGPVEQETGLGPIIHNVSRCWRRNVQLWHRLSSRFPQQLGCWLAPALAQPHAAQAGLTRHVGERNCQAPPLFPQGQGRGVDPE